VVQSRCERSAKEPDSERDVRGRREANEQRGTQVSGKFLRGDIKYVDSASGNFSGEQSCYDEGLDRRVEENRGGVR